MAHRMTLVWYLSPGNHFVSDIQIPHPASRVSLSAPKVHRDNIVSAVLKGGD